MEKFLEKILNNTNIFRNDSVVKKINAGFTNSLFLVDNKYIVKICNNKDNEEKFKNEISFYNRNKNNKFIPKIYLYHIAKEKEDYSYIVIEFIRGKTLYNVWHELNEEERKLIIKKIVDLMKTFHSIKGNRYDWAKYMKNKINQSLNFCRNKNLFSLSELKLFKYILTNMDKYLKSDDFRLIHSDIHFDNIIVDENKNLKLIDFETSMYAPIDYELDIFLRMCKNPLTYASEEEAKFVNIEDYKMIEPYFREMYPEIFAIHDFNIRNKIYNLEANLRLLPKFPNDVILKNDVLKDLIKLREMFN